VSEDYLGGTESELRDAPLARRVFAYVDQRVLFPHQGYLRLEPQALILGNWRVIPRAAITSVELTFTDVYRRGQAAGVRGNWASLGFIGSLGKPLVLGIADGEPVYLLIGFRYFSGINSDRWWMPILHDWIRQRASV
jgi:hypothetical protein